MGRFATTRAKLSAYLARKIRERGWAGEKEPDLAALAERFASQGYVDDSAYALSKARALAGRGYGHRRVVEKLRVAGVGEDDSRAAREHSERQAVAAALRFAERRRLGPFAGTIAKDRGDREKAIAAMIRAGHPFGLARAILAIEPGTAIDLDELAERAGLTLI